MWSIFTVSFLSFFLILHLELGTRVTIPLSGYEAERKEVVISAPRSPVLLPSAYDLVSLPGDRQYLLPLFIL